VSAQSGKINSRFIDLEDGEGELKVPVGISLRQSDE
jgi:hypothetical protein